MVHYTVQVSQKDSGSFLFLFVFNLHADSEIPVRSRDLLTQNLTLRQAEIRRRGSCVGSFLLKLKLG